MMPKENFYIGRIFVRVIRTLANVQLWLLSVAAAIWALFVMGSSVCDFWNQSDERESLEQRIAAIPAERDKAVAALAQQEAQEAERLKNEIAAANTDWAQRVRAYNECRTATAESVKAAVPDQQINGQNIGLENLATLADCQTASGLLQQASQHVSRMKNSLFADMEADVNTLVRSLEERKREKLAKVAELEQAIARLQAEIEAIKARYTVTREVITTYWQRDQLLRDHCVYDLRSQSGEDVSQHARDLSTVGYMLPVHVNRLSPDSKLLSPEVLASLGLSASRLSAWLPIVAIGGKEEVRTEEQIPMDPLVLSEADRLRIQELQNQIYQSREQMNALSEEIKGCSTELENLAQVQRDMEAGKAIALSGWKVDAALSPLPGALSRVQSAISALEQLRVTFENKKNQLITQYQNEESAALARIEASWKEDCASSQNTIVTMFWWAFPGPAAGWLLWVILMLWMDFAAAILIAALRAQAAHEMLCDRKD